MFACSMSCGGESFTPDGAFDSLWDSAKLTTGRYTINYFHFQEDVGCVCMLNDWIKSNDEICADNYDYFPFMFKGQGRSELLEMTIPSRWTVIVRMCFPGILAFVMSALVLHPLWRCVCHPSVTWECA